MKVYVASSWRNYLQPGIVHALRRCGHEVYDFRHPAPGKSGFSWKQVSEQYENGGKVDADEYRKMLAHEISLEGWNLDIGALRECDAVVYVLPCGRSASWEFGYAMGQGKRAYVVMFEPDEPDLMFMGAEIIGDMDQFFACFGEPKSDD